MYKLIITNKRSITKLFKTLQQLSEYASKNRYKQGGIILFKDDEIIIAGKFMYEVNKYAIKELIK